MTNSITQNFNLFMSGQDECYAHLEAKCKEMLEAGCKLEHFHIQYEQLYERPFPVGGMDTKWVFRLMYGNTPVAEATLNTTWNAV